MTPAAPTPARSARELPRRRRRRRWAPSPPPVAATAEARATAAATTASRRPPPRHRSDRRRPAPSTAPPGGDSSWCRGRRRSHDRVALTFHTNGDLGLVDQLLDVLDTQAREVTSFIVGELARRQPRHGRSASPTAATSSPTTPTPTRRSCQLSPDATARRGGPLSRRPRPPHRRAGADVPAVGHRRRHRVARSPGARQSPREAGLRHRAGLRRRSRSTTTTPVRTRSCSAPSPPSPPARSSACTSGTPAPWKRCRRSSTASREGPEGGYGVGPARLIGQPRKAPTTPPGDSNPREAQHASEMVHQVK